MNDIICIICISISGIEETIKNYQLQIIHYFYERVDAYNDIDQKKKERYQNKEDLDFKRYERRIAKTVMSSFI